MRLDRVDLNLFVVFDVLYQERSVTQAAQALHVTQPAVSNALSRLRSTFNDKLFVRSPSGMLPTPVADSAIMDVRKALKLLGNSVAMGAVFEPAEAERKFHLSMSDLLQTLLLPTVLQELTKSAPGIDLICYPLEREKSAEELKSGRTDLVFDAPLFNARDFRQAPLLDLEYVVAMRPTHPLAQPKLSLDDYLSARHIHVSSRRRGRGQADIALHSQAHKRQVVLRVQDYLVAQALTAENDVLWTVPKALVANSNLHLCAPPLRIEPLKLNLFWSKQANDDPANRWLRNLFIDTVRTTMN